MFRKKILAFTFTATSFFSLSQDFLSSQTAADNVGLNPSLAGNNNIGRLAFNYRNQWPKLTGNYVTYNGNFYQYLPKLNGYGGIRFMNDVQARTFYTNSTSLFYGQNINIGNVLFRPSLEIGYTQMKVDDDQIIYNNDSSQISEIHSKSNYLDLNIGTLFSYKNLTLGFSAHHLNAPTVNLSFMNPYTLSPKYGAQFSYQFNLENAKLNISPFVIYQSQNAFQQFRYGINLLYKKHYNFAFSSTNWDMLIFNFGYQNQFFAVNYSYDFTVSKLNNGISGGAHELSLIFKFWKRNPTKKLLEVNSVFQ